MHSLLGRRSTLRGIPAAVRVAVLFSLLAGPAARHAEAQGVPAGTHIRSWATVSFVLSSQPFLLSSDTSDVVVAQVAGADLEPPRVTTGTVGSIVLLQQALKNVGNGTDSFTVTATSARGWIITLFRDLNEDGVINGGDAPLSGPVLLGYGAHAALLTRVAVPNDPALEGVSDTVQVTATSQFDSGVSDQLAHRIDISAAPVTVAISKVADRVTAVPGDPITYTLSYSAAGAGAATAFVIQDSVPSGTGYLPGTLRWNGVSMTDAAGDDAGTVGAAGNGVVTVDLGAVAAGAAGTVSFQAQASAGPARTVSNRAHLVYAWGGITDTVYTNDAVTTVFGSELSLAKSLVGPAAAGIGQEVTYLLRYANLSGTSIVPGVTLADSLPAGLEYVRATPAPTLVGPALRWSLGALSPGDSGSIDLVVRVSGTVRDTSWVSNTASLVSALPGALPQSATAGQVALIGPTSAGIALDLTADVLEVGLGDVIPYTAIARNTGTGALDEIVMTAVLPQGGRYARGSATGIDSVRAIGNQLLLYTAAPLAVAASRTLHFGVALVSASSTIVETRASATAHAATANAFSAVAVAGVQVRRAWPMETRAVIGKVWADREGDGVQNTGDAGLAGIEVWTEDGEVATTDATGKFSFSNLRPGRHALRLDPRSLAGDYRVIGDEIRSVEATGWTTPRVDFRVAPLGASVTDVRQLIQLRFGATPVRSLELPGAVSGIPAGGFRAGSHARIRYDVTVQRQPDAEVDALVGFSPAVDSATVYVDGAIQSEYVWTTHTMAIPRAHPGADIRIVAWASVPADSVTLRILGPGVVARARAQVSDTLKTVLVSSWVGLPSKMLPLTEGVQRSGSLEVSLEPARGAWPEAVYVLPAGWRAIAGSTRLGGKLVGDPAIERDGAGRVRLRWEFKGAKPAPITFQVTTDPVLAAAPETVYVTRARTTASQAAERRASLVDGPRVAFMAPDDGAVLPGDRVYIGVKGEPGKMVVLYDGVAPIDSAPVRVDGSLDFIAVPLARGPHLLRTRMTNSSGRERWDSMAVHVTGLPARIEAPKRVALVADGRSVVVATVRVLDAWGVPVIQPAYVTVTAQGAEPMGEDADPSSVGLQLLTSSSGRLEVALRPGHEVEAGSLQLKSGDAKAAVALEIHPQVRPLTITGAGSVGVGASADAYGAVTARGRLDDRTSVSLTLDSRSLDAGRDVFGRQQDPLDESQYPILGDASHVETRAASTSWFSAKLERGFDWVSVGDVATNDFAGGLQLAGYRRAVNGVAGRLTTGPITWSGFGSMTSQALRQLQIRGAGVSGPYELGRDVLAGTEQLRLETRALENPERAIVTQGLTRFVDYQIDYASGVVLFKQPVPAADAAGNPVYVVATFEAASGGEQRLVAGGRAALDLKGAFASRQLDSLRLGITAVNAEQATDPYRLVGADIRALRFGGLDVGAEVAYSEQGDSTGLATAARAGYGLAGGRVTVGASYMMVGREFTNPSNVALRPGTTELTLRGGLKVGPSTLRVDHAWQEFQLDGISRQTTRVGVLQSFGRHVDLDAGVARRSEDNGLGSLGGESQSGDAKLTVKPTADLQVWAEGRRQFAHSGDLTQPDFWGIGSAYRVSPAVALEAGHRFVTPTDGESYAVSSVGVRADVGFGTQAWGSYQLSGGTSGARNAAVIGLNNRLRLTPGLGLNLMFERRVGVDRASAADPVRAAPFLQAEEDYWSGGLGIDLTPDGAPYRLTARGEYKDGALQSTRLVTLAGDVTLNASFAVLSRQEFAQADRPDVALARRWSSLWGVAFRPAKTDRLNVLAKFQWTDDQNPIGGGVLVSQGQERKLIGAADVIWTPLRGTEFGTRYAIRRTDAVREDGTGTSQPLTSRADYVGSHMSVDVTRWLAVRGDGRLLIERTSATQRWDAAPSIALRLINGLEIAGGYRFGDLQDPDFSVRGGRGLFVSLSASLTEKQFPTAADFWRSRF